jgi:hypothetical protein
MGPRAVVRGTRALKGQPPAMLLPMGLGRGHGAQRSKPARLDGVANSGELGALGVGFMVLGFILCYVILARPKNYTMCRFWISNG